MNKLRRRLKVLARPRRLYHTLGTRLARRRGWQRLPFLPTDIDLEPIDLCNFACDHCQVTHWQRVTSRLSLERFGALLRQLPMLRHIKLQGMGEPLLNRGLPEMLEQGEARGIAMTITSNGSVYTEQIAERLSALRDTTITVSVDGATAETFEAIRVKGNFELVTANVADLVRRREGRAWPRIELRAVATSRNVHEMPDLARLAQSLGVDQLTITCLLTDWGKGEMAAAIAAINIARDNARAEEFIGAAVKVAAEIGLPLAVERGQRFSPSYRCYWPWYKTYIAANGDVVPCCEIADSSVVKMGNVFEERFADIWNNDRYRELRRRIAGDDIPDYCRGCYGLKPVAGED